MCGSMADIQSAVAEIRQGKKRKKKKNKPQHENIYGLPIPQGDHKPVTIFSDSLSSLQAIKTGKTTCRPNLLVEIQELITTCKTEITFVWIPSHIGIKGKEIADKLANLATSSNCVELNIGLELSEAYALVDKYILGKWQDMWDNCLH